MTKPVCCLFLALGFAACAPKKAILVESDTPATTGTRGKPANKPTGSQVPKEGDSAPLVIQEGGMRLPTDRLLRLPDKKDLTPTAPVGPGGGGVIATPPTADKRNGE
ncbi:hypothetical protein OKA05_05550 [Luteolibacter arcticus]|uniref:Lipoprotein n=1 Tax=Luteolibacter arcticus TaxID=1581411 RepID=A0ABT3GEG0_9BACT|nr:hypothetical protein [Luteolibacter arcticus]MCW1922007.1 hypothetical protein [Luteolibacter arcticus]